MEKKSRASRALEKAEKREAEVKELRKKVFEAIDLKKIFSKVITIRGATHTNVAAIDYCHGEVFATSTVKKNGFYFKLTNVSKLIT